MELTPWFEPHEKPLRSGPYEVKGNNGQVVYSFWNSLTEVWGYVAYTPAGAQGMRDKASHSQNKTWRGIIR